jgi:hypothetical protein
MQPLPSRVRMEPTPPPHERLSPPFRFADINWAQIPDEAGVYVIYDGDEFIYVGMAGRDGRGACGDDCVITRADRS